MGGVFVGIPRQLALDLKEKYRLSGFIETGLLHGDSALWASGHFRPVVSIESHENYVTGFRNNHPDTDVQIIHGDSATWLRQVLTGIEQPALIWLDAHFDNGLHYHEPEATVCPVLAEIEQIRDSGLPHVVLIDDARLFGEKAAWPTVRQVRVALRKTGRTTTIVNDVIIGLPGTPRGAAPGAPLPRKARR